MICQLVAKPICFVPDRDEKMLAGVGEPVSLSVFPDRSRAPVVQCFLRGGLFSVVPAEKPSRLRGGFWLRGTMA